MDISRNSYVGATDPKTVRGLTFDLFEALFKKLEDLPCKEGAENYIRLEGKIDTIAQRTIWFYLGGIKGRISIRQVILMAAFIGTLIAGGVNHTTITSWIKLLTMGG